jgi:predicted nucleic acid-binding protein
MRAVVADASPIRYLVLIGAIDYLEQLYGQILIPAVVAGELQATSTPTIVRNWMQTPPSWVEVVATLAITTNEAVSSHLDPGETQVLRMALHLRSDLVFIDERRGVHEAQRLGLNSTGTLGILVKFAEAGWIDLKLMLEELGKTNFRVSPRLIQQVLDVYRG